MFAKMAPQGMACLVKVRLCHELADCINIDGSYECVCKDGNTGDGMSCEGKVDGRYECVCKDGTTGDGLSCEGKVMS